MLYSSKCVPLSNFVNERFFVLDLIWLGLLMFCAWDVDLGLTLLCPGEAGGGHQGGPAGQAPGHGGGGRQLGRGQGHAVSGWASLEFHEMSDTKEIVFVRNLSQEARWCGHCVHCPRGSDSPATSGTLCFCIRLSVYINHLQFPVSALGVWEAEGGGGSDWPGAGLPQGSPGARGQGGQGGAELLQVVRTEVGQDGAMLGLDQDREGGAW